VVGENVRDPEVFGAERHGQQQRQEKEYSLHHPFILKVETGHFQAGLAAQVFGRGFAWLDTGTHDSLAEASIYIETIEKRQGLKVACLEEIAYQNGWITAEKLREIAAPMAKNPYGQYLMRLVDKG
jgi:glucose-1-phosphate thymidylyltransferase